jgi:hypothetical protein
MATPIFKYLIYVYRSMAKYLTVALILIVAVLAVIFVVKEAQVITAYAGYGSSNTSYGTANVTNPAPTIENVMLIDSPNDASDVNQITLYGGQQKTIICNGTVDDQTGAADISTANATIYGTGSTYGAADNTTIHYTNSSCTLTAKNTTAKYANCNFSVWYHAYNGTWTCDMRAVDAGSNSSGSTGTDTSVINKLVALQVPATLAFGTLAPAGTSSTDVNMTIQNYGNIRFDLALNGTDMTCAQGTIGVANIHYNCTNYGSAFASMSPLAAATTSVNCTGFDLVPTTNSSAPTANTKDLPWKLYVNQANSPRGNCQGTIWFVAQEG